MMATDQGPIVQSALLRSELARLRKQKGMTQEQVARTLEWSPSKLIRVEGGKSSITRTDLQALLRVYEVTPESRQERLQALARGAREPAWWNEYKGQVEDSLLNYVGYAAGASHIRGFQGALVPGLLQTREYAEVLATGIVDPTTRIQGVQLRLQRQRELAQRADPPKQHYILDEAVIRRHVGVMIEPATMPNQLRHMADTAEQGDLLSIQVIPFSAGAHLGLYGPFTLLEFDGDLGDVLYIEGRPGTSLTASGDDAQVADYRANFELLLEMALPVDRSVELIRQTAEDLMA